MIGEQCHVADGRVDDALDQDPLDLMREERRKAEEECKKAEAAANTTLKAVCEDWLVREAGMKRAAGGDATFGGTLRSAKERLQIFERLVYPQPIAGRQIDEIRRSELVKLLDRIEDRNGARMAHVTLAYLSKVFNWHASRDDSFRSPIVRGMGRVKPRERARERTLTDEEIRDVWTGLDERTNGIADGRVKPGERWSVVCSQRHSRGRARGIHAAVRRAP